MCISFSLYLLNTEHLLYCPSPLHCFIIHFISVFSPYFIEKKHGFIHNVSPVKTSKRTQHQWYDFQLQTVPNKIRRVVSFNPSFHTHMQHYEQSKTLLSKR